MGVEEYARAAAALAPAPVFLTNHGDMRDFHALAALLPPETLLVAGVEVSTPAGDFLVFSTDVGFLEELGPAAEDMSGLRTGGDSIVVWAHPFAGIAGGLPPADPHVREVAAQVDGIEVYNGNWPDEAASRRALAAAERYGLAAMGGSDAHHRSQLMRCWTEVRVPLAGPADFLDRVRRRETLPGREAAPR